MREKLSEKLVKEWGSQDQDMMQILTILASLKLADSWLCAGSIRNFIWNRLSGKVGFDDKTDVDVIFYDDTLSYDETLKIEESLRHRHPLYQWELKNQVYMHIHNPNTSSYQNSKDAMSKYPETCTALGIRLLETGKLDLFCPYGLEDIGNFIVRPTPHFQADTERYQVYCQRLMKKDWKKKWPQLQLIGIAE